MLRRLLREPLLHVLALGVLLFALQRAVAPPSASEEIVVPGDALAGMREEFRRRTGRMPSATDEQAMLEKWVDDEVLVREALAMGLDRGDSIVRRRLMQKMEYLLENTEPVPAPTDAELETFLKAHADRYASPARVSFAHVFVSAQQAGAGATESTVVDNESGLALRLTYFRQFYQDEFSFDALWGSAVPRAELGVRIAG